MGNPKQIPASAAPGKASCVSQPTKARFVVKTKTANVVAVEWVNDDDWGRTPQKTVDLSPQLVNLERDPKWVGKHGAANLDRLGRKPCVRVRFDAQGACPYKLRLIKRPNSPVYTQDEQGRNANFKADTTEQYLTSDADGTAVVAVTLDVSGGAKWSVEVEDEQGNVARTPELETLRHAYYFEIKMKGASPATDLGPFRDEFERHGIKLAGMGSVEMEALPNVDDENASDCSLLKSKARKAYSRRQASAKDRDPYLISVAYMQHLAVKSHDVPLKRRNMKVGPGAQKVRILSRVRDRFTGVEEEKALWVGLVSGESWYVSSKFRQNGSLRSQAIPEAACIPVATNSNRPDFYNAVDIDVSGLRPGVGTITIKANLVDCMCGGLEFPDSNLICVCTRAWWNMESSRDQVQILIHELGHKFGMVPNGSDSALHRYYDARLPDKPESYYDNVKGHVGPHCYFGLPDNQARYDNDTDRAASKCVMYGATNGKIRFCGNCGPALRKVDLARGWLPF